MKLWEHTVDEILALPIDALSMLVLQDFGADGWNVSSYFAESKNRHPSVFKDVAARLGTAWAWLEANVLIGRHSTQDSANARQITEIGRDALQNGLSRLRAGQRLGVDLHPLIAAQIRTQFLIGQFELAAFAALREVEIRVRTLGHFNHDDIGIKLMTAAFNPKTPGPLVDVAAEAGEQEALMALFRGAIGTFKNPSSHRAVDYEDATFAAEVVLLADLLLRMLDRLKPTSA